MWRRDLTDLVDAHERLGGVLGGALRAHIDAIDESWRQRVAQSSEVGRQKVGRNDPCPCRSGKKYKTCCLGRAAAGPSIIASPAVSREKLALAEDYFRQRDAGRGPAQQFIDFAQPLLDSTDGSKTETQRALTLAQFLWNIAITRDPEEREGIRRAAARHHPRHGARSVRGNRAGDAPAASRDVPRPALGRRLTCIDRVRDRRITVRRVGARRAAERPGAPLRPAPPPTTAARERRPSRTGRPGCRSG